MFCVSWSISKAGCGRKCNKVAEKRLGGPGHLLIPSTQGIFCSKLDLAPDCCCWLRWKLGGDHLNHLDLTGWKARQRKKTVVAKPIEKATEEDLWSRPMILTSWPCLPGLIICSIWSQFIAQLSCPSHKTQHLIRGDSCVLQPYDKPVVVVAMWGYQVIVRYLFCLLHHMFAKCLLLESSLTTIISCV